MYLLPAGLWAGAEIDATAILANLVPVTLGNIVGGGVLVALAEKFGLPVHAVGVGEAIDDLRPFAAEDFARALVGLAD